MIKGVIFDIDGVLLDSMEIWDDLGAVYLKSMDVVPEEGLNTILFSMSMEEGAAYLKEYYMLKQSTEAILCGIQKLIEDFYFYRVSAKDGAKEMMCFLKERGIGMTAATSSPRLHVEKALERNGLLCYLDRIFTTGETGISKHSPDIYDLAAAHLKSGPGETLVLEDSLYALRTAKEAGYITMGVYDAKGETDQEGVKNTGDRYLKDLRDFDAAFEYLQDKTMKKEKDHEDSINDSRK